MLFTLPNGKPIDKDMVEQALEDGNLEHSYYLNTQTGVVAFLSASTVTLAEREKRLEEIEASGEYIPIERLSSHVAYQWMEDFVAEIVAPEDARTAEKLSIALMGKGAFRRFKDVLQRVGDEWAQAWYRWRDEQLTKAIKKWFAGLPVTITEEAHEQ